MAEKELAVCDECGSLFFKGSSQMMGLCPECAHILYGYPNCDHHFQNGRCVNCNMAWEYETFGPDGQCKLFGVNIFDYDWQTTGKRVKVKDPIYHQDHTFEVWQVEIDGQIHRFAAGEFSNCVWGFYLEKNG